MTNKEGKIIGVIGAGEIGQAVGKILTETGCSVIYWDKENKNLTTLSSAVESLPELISESAIIVLAVPAKAVREVLMFGGRYFKEGQIIVSLAKGLDPVSGLTAWETVKKILGRKKIPLALISGPMLAEELEAGGHGLAMISGAPTAIKLVEKLFNGSRLRLFINNDPNGLAWLGVTKNIYALGLGVGDALNWPSNQKGEYVCRVLTEMSKINRYFGAKGEAVFGIAGLGDFLATGFSGASANRTVGERLVRGQSIGQPSEGFLAAPILAKRLGATRALKLPILVAIARICIGEQNAGEAWKELGLI